MEGWRKRLLGLLAGVVAALVALCAVLYPREFAQLAALLAPQPTAQPAAPAIPFDLAAIPAFQGEPWVEINGGAPYFTQEERTAQSFERYSDLDALGRCGPAYACVGRDLMPTQPREEIGMIRPSGWHTVRYDDLVEGKYLYNRCHLIGYQLTGENANEKNLITGTRFCNTRGMLPWEDQVADYVRETGNHVLYRATPAFEGEELVARGVLLEALSVEDGGDGVRFCVYVYNAQPGVTIDYATGESWRTEEAAEPPAA